MNWTNRFFNQSRFGTIKAIRRVIVFVIGGSIVLIGIALIVLPGPAFVVIPVGLAILASEQRHFRAGAAKIAHERPAQRVRKHPKTRSLCFTPIRVQA
jgi:putative transmembrane protein PGPGW